MNPHNKDVYSAYNKPEAVIDWLAHNEVASAVAQRLMRLWLVSAILPLQCTATAACDAQHSHRPILGLRSLLS